MSTGKKQKKRKCRSPPPPPSLKPQLAQRLERLRSGQRDLWADDDDINSKSKQSRKKSNNQPIILLSDSEEEISPLPSQGRSQIIKSKKKISQNHDENVNKNPTCLICSIFSQLSSHNCCSEHLSILKNHSDHHVRTTNGQHLPEKVMIVPITDEIVQHYLDSQQIYQLRTQASPSRTTKKRSTVQSVSKATMTSDESVVSHPIIRIPRVIREPSQMDIEPLCSTIVVETAAITTSDVATSPSKTNHIENTTTSDIIPIPESSIETITIDDNSIDDQQDHIDIKSTNESGKLNPWDPIRDEIDDTLERVLNQVDSTENSTLEFTPTTARRTNTEVMAALLPKIPLKEGRFRQGKSIMNRTLSNAANEYRPSATVSFSPKPTSATPQSSSPPMLTNVENTSTPDQTSNILKNNRTTDVTSSQLLTLDETNQHDNIPITTVTRTDVDLPVVSATNIELEIDQSHEEQNVTSSTTNERTTTTTTPVRMSYRLNPDGTRVTISRPLLPTSRQSPLVTSLRRNSTDVTPIQPNTN
ncbi:unnamed protein product [Rotaria socialis]|uniref:Uncharacterized protein n=1 Tax=Rotaria socialis TaxID=392032 RepID=A0A817W3Y7_9BILA|nr:unnamed protein product [Rotaria socialis]CAF4532190.1 unnamed protein product [Rotaria socialis]